MADFRFDYAAAFGSAYAFFIGKEIAAVGIAGLIISMIQLVFLILPVIPTEIALKKNFDKDGNRRN